VEGAQAQEPPRTRSASGAANDSERVDELDIDA